MKTYKIVILRRNIGDCWTTINDWFIQGFRESGHQSIPVNIPFWGAHIYNPYPSATKTNRYRLRKIVKKYNPDTVFVIHGGGYWSREMLEDMKSFGLHLVYYNPDDPMLFQPVSWHIAPFCDTVLTFPKVVEVYKQRLGIDAHAFFYCLDPDVEKGPEPGMEIRQTHAADILMTGVINPLRKQRRGELLYRLHRSGIGTVVHYGPPCQDAPEYLKQIYRGQIPGNKIHNLILRSAKIIFHHTQELPPEEQDRYLPDTYQSLSGRLLDGAAAGCLVMTNYFADLEKVFDIKKEVVVYRDADDAVEKARYYLQHPEEREKIAQAGKKKVMDHHTVKNRVRQILAIMENHRS